MSKPGTEGNPDVKPVPPGQIPEMAQIILGGEGWIGLDSTGGIWRSFGITRGPHIVWTRIPAVFFEDV